MAQDLTIGERLGWYRRRRGLSQEVLAGLVGRTEDWMSKVENNRIPLDRLSVIRLLAEALDIGLGDLIGEPALLDWTPRSGTATIPALRAALMDYTHLLPQEVTQSGSYPTLDLAESKQELRKVFDAYQAAQFGYAAGRLPGLIRSSQLMAHKLEREHVYRLLALSYQAAASVLIKLGETDLAWNAAERGLAAGRRIDDPAVVGSLMRSVAFSIMATGRFQPAINLVEVGVRYLQPHLTDEDETLLSVYGTLLLVGAMAAARHNKRGASQDFLNEAEETATRLGEDRNFLWTAFGPTNVAIHRVNTAMELGDVQVALQLGPIIDTADLPLERRVRHLLELARAFNLAGQRSDAITIVVEAYCMAPEQVQYHYISRQLVLTWMRTTSGSPSFAVQDLAQRMKIVR